VTCAAAANMDPVIEPPPEEGTTITDGNPSREVVIGGVCSFADGIRKRCDVDSDRIFIGCIQSVETHLQHRHLAVNFFCVWTVIFERETASFNKKNDKKWFLTCKKNKETAKKGDKLFEKWIFRCKIWSEKCLKTEKLCTLMSVSHEKFGSATVKIHVSIEFFWILLDIITKKTVS